MKQVAVIIALMVLSVVSCAQQPKRWSTGSIKQLSDAIDAERAAGNMP